MSIEQVKEFLKEIGADPDLADQVWKNGEDLQGLIDLGKKRQFDFTPEDVKALHQEMSVEDGELSDEQLENVAGGFISTTAALVVSAMVSAVTAVRLR